MPPEQIVPLYVVVVSDTHTARYVYGPFAACETADEWMEAYERPRGWTSCRVEVVSLSRP